MREFHTVMLILLACSAQADAKTYELTYTGNKLTRIDHNDKPIKGVTNLSLIFSAEKPFPKNTCFDVPVTELSGLSDGVDTLATLAADGYAIADQSGINLCTDATGKGIVSWQIGLGFQANSEFNNQVNTYTAVTYSTPTQNEIYYDYVYFNLARKRVSHRKHEMEENATAAGTWAYSVTD